MRLVVELDQAAALHLAYALRAHRAYCARAGYVVPDAIDVLTREADRVARNGQERPSVETPSDNGLCASDDDTSPRVLTRAEFAQATGRKERTVRRWVQEGRVVEGIPYSEVQRVKERRRNGIR
ncbi:MAG TPA: hypothetical protein VFG75_07975 [Gaiella sp.]|nr:hypothetical protein [Gaiella sp.]